MKAECPDQIFVLQQLRQVSKQVEAENGRRANLVVWSSTFSTHRQFVIDGRPVQRVLVVLVQFENTSPERVSLLKNPFQGSTPVYSPTQVLASSNPGLKLANAFGIISN